MSRLDLVTAPENRGMKIRHGVQLDNGAIVVAASESVKTPITVEHCIVLALIPSNILTPWATWLVSTDPEAYASRLVAFEGDYFRDIEAAAAGFKERVDVWAAAFDFHVKITGDKT